MKKIINTITALSVCAITTLSVACESREQNSYGEDCTPLSSPNIELSNAQYNSLTFKWASVSNAIEYGYTLKDSDGNVIEGGLTKVDSVKIEGLTYCTEYTFHIFAYASVLGENTTSKESILTASTTFWPAVNESGTYVSVLQTTTTWNPTLVEERVAGKESEFGTFTLQSWYNHDGYDLQFTVNADKSINILNGTDDESGWLKVLAGPSTTKTNVYVRNGVLIDVAKCSFDRENRTLKLHTKSTRTSGENREGDDVFSW